jgi:hypothetical protein
MVFDMDLVLLVGIAALSFSVALAGARVLLWSVFCLMSPSIPVSPVATAGKLET